MVFGHKMAHKLTWYSGDGKKTNFICYVISQPNTGWIIARY